VSAQDRSQSDVFADVVVGEFVRQVEAFERLARRLLASFADIAQEARDEADRVYRERCTRPGEGGDLDAAAEAASDAALELYVSLAATKQAAVSLLAAGLYHLFEQQQKRAPERLRIAWNSYKSWTPVYELHLVANAVKHGEGRSAKELRGRRPDMFRPPELARLGAELPPVQVVGMPLAGVDLYVTEKDLENYAGALKQLWEEVAKEHRSQNQLEEH